MDEALRLFNSILNNKWFLDTSVILFLNKKDLFERKIRERPLPDVFPDFRGKFLLWRPLPNKCMFEKCSLSFSLSLSLSLGNNTYQDGINFIRDKFVRLNKNPGRKTVYTHVTCATDTSNIQFVFESVTDIIIAEHLRETGLFWWILLCLHMQHYVVVVFLSTCVRSCMCTPSILYCMGCSLSLHLCMTVSDTSQLIEFSIFFF